MVVEESNGLPFGFHPDVLAHVRSQTAEQALDTIKVSSPRGDPKQQPEKLVADRRYDSSPFRRLLRRRGIRMCIPLKRPLAKWRTKRGRLVVAPQVDYRHWYKMERSFAWLGILR